MNHIERSPRKFQVRRMGLGKIAKMWTEGVPVEDQALEQVDNVARLPFIYKHVAVMPDVHWGMGATVGSVIPTKGAIIPAAVGVDIGCGMAAIRLEGIKAEHLPDSLSTIRSEIEKHIPVGFGYHQKYSPPENEVDLDWLVSFISDHYPEIGRRRKQSIREIVCSQLGTLGGGNHFIEMCIDESDDVWVMLHSGSRGIGNLIGTFFIGLAKKDMEKFFVSLPDENLAYFPEGTDHFNDYVDMVGWAQNYASRNRQQMMNIIAGTAGVLRHYLPPYKLGTKAVNCHHNYVERENHFGENVLITRKGAVRARTGDLGIIPGSMGAKSYIVRGKGNPESFHSCSHGAGRVMSRAKAKKAFTLADHEKATEGVECRKDAGVIDETPGAYKSIDAVMEAQTDLVEVIHTLKQVMCIKG